MARLSEPRSRLALWSRRLAIFAVPVAVLATLLHRFGAIDTAPALASLGIAIILAVLAVLAGFGGLATVWRHGYRGVPQCLIGICLGLAVLAWPAYRAAGVVLYPPIYDVTTDPDDPPALDAAARLRPAGANPTAYPGAFARQQREAYPEVRPVVIDRPAETVLEAARLLIARRGWQEIVVMAPGISEPGHIEAVALTPVFGFRDDVAIRVTPLDEATSLVDMRSASRLGRHDLGANAQRIYRFLSELGPTADEIAAPPLPDA